MLQIGVLALEECPSIATFGLFDVITRADQAYGALQGRPGSETLYGVQVVGLDGSPVGHGDRFHAVPDAAAADIDPPDLVVVPGLDVDLAASFERNRAWAPWLQRWHSAGTTIAASCSGTFLVAEAGLLDDRLATTHWLYAAELARMFPEVHVGTERLLIDHGDVITSGGATTFLDLALYLVERFGGADRANAAARMLIVDRERTSQLPYVVPPATERLHRNELVHRAQDYMDVRLRSELRVADIARAVGVSHRTLSRHFRNELSTSVQAHLRDRRIEAAKRALEASDEPVENIRRSVGYKDPTSFRRAFREHTGLSPGEFRSKFRRPAPEVSRSLA